MPAERIMLLYFEPLFASHPSSSATKAWVAPRSLHAVLPPLRYCALSCIPVLREGFEMVRSEYVKDIDGRIEREREERWRKE